MSKQRWSATKDAFPDRKDENGNKLCCYCGKMLIGQKRRYCSSECFQEVYIRCRPNYARGKVWRRDRGVCAICGKDTNALSERLKKTIKKYCYEGTRYVRHLRKGGKERAKRINRHLGFDAIVIGRRQLYADVKWEVDHIKPVIEGGGLCGLENLRTVCTWCHKKLTAELAGRRARLALEVPPHYLEKSAADWNLPLFDKI